MMDNEQNPKAETEMDDILLSETQTDDEEAGKTADPAQTVRKSRFGFYKILLMIASLMLIAIGVGTFIFWQFINAYEISRPEHIIKSLQDNIDYDFWERAAVNSLTPLLTEFETDGYTAMNPHIGKIRDVPYYFRQKTDESTSGSPVYIVRAGARDIGIVRLSSVGDAGFGFNLWEVGSIEFLDSFLDGFSSQISITASQNATVLINGVQVSDVYRTECEFEHGAAYLVNGIFGDAAVSVNEFDGRTTEPFYAERNDYIFPIIEPFKRRFNIIAPADADIFVDGDRILPEHITVFGFLPDILGDETDILSIPISFTQHRYEFEMDGFYSDPIVTARDGMGTELSYNISEMGEIVFELPYDLGLKDDYEAVVDSFIRAYIDFGANAGNNEEANFANVSNKILRGTDLFRRTQGAISAMQFTSNVVIHYNYLEIDKFRAFGDDYFTCEIRYNITHRTRYMQSEVEGNFEALFVLNAGRWLAVKMVAI